MNRFLKTTAMVLVLGLSAQTAQAEVFFWQDPVSNMTLTYPDRWAQVNNQNPGDIITIRAPGDNDYAECRVNVAEDGRFKIIPIDYSPQIQRLNVSDAYWDHFFSTYDDAALTPVADNAGLGRGFASTVQATYETPVGTPMTKQAVAFASYFNNRIYALECSAEASTFEKWKPAFLSFVKSIDFEKHTNHAYTGYYRDFLEDKTLIIRGPSYSEDMYY